MKKSKVKKGTLYLCPTPIGNLQDITLRTLKVLKNVDYIAAEDTRVTVKLLNHYNIKKALISYHEHNKQKKGPEIISLLINGKNIALVTDAGTPGISDPGQDLVQQSIKKRIKIVPLPGATAFVCALIASGLSTEQFVFEGFLPRKSKDRRERLSKLKNEERTIVFYEAPHRILKTLKHIKRFLGNRNIVIAREMTKLHEEFFRGKTDDAILHYTENKPRGEMVIIVGGQEKSEEVDTVDIKFLGNIKSILNAKIAKYQEKGISKNKSLKKAGADVGLSRNEVYELLLE